MIRRTIREWSYLELEPPGPGAFTRTHADKLVEKAILLSMSGEEGERVLVNHPKKLRAQQVVGVLAADDVCLEILPKIDGGESDASARRSLIHMLAAVYDLPIHDGAVTELSWQRDDLLEILIRLFCDQLFAVVHRGLPRAYVQHEDDLRALRGRMDVIRQFSVLAASPQRLACRYDELSSDIALNQVMKAAVTCLRKRSRSHDNQRKLYELELAFADVATVPVQALRWESIIIDRTNRAWSQLLALARLLLGNRFQTTSLGDSQGFSLLFEMNTLFEEFVGRALERALAGTPIDVRLQGPRSFALQDLSSNTSRFATKPDISLRLGSHSLMVIDTKWKRLKGAIDDPKQGVSQADIYQMMAYSHVYGCDRLMLLYPHHSELGEHPGALSTHRIVGTDDSQISVASLSLKDPKKAAQSLKSWLLSPDGMLTQAMQLAA